MSYPPALTHGDREILRIIDRGHPTRTMTVIINGTTIQIPALLWDEVQIAANISHDELAESIVRLVSNKAIDSGSRQQDLIDRLIGKTPIRFFWSTKFGQSLLRPHDNHADITETPSGIDGTTIAEVAACLRELGYDLTPYGTGLALLEVASGYSAAETASHIALTTLAGDIEQAGLHISNLMAFVPHAKAMMQVLAEFRDAGKMREQLFQNDANAILRVATIDSKNREWLRKVLSDPIATKEPVAKSRIKYNRAVPT